MHVLDVNALLQTDAMRRLNPQLCAPTPASTTKAKSHKTPPISDKMNMTELFYYRDRIEPGLFAKDISWYQFNRFTVILQHSPRITYTVDFVYQRTDELPLYMVEIKALSTAGKPLMDEADRLKLNALKGLFPQFHVILAAVNERSGIIQEQEIG